MLYIALLNIFDTIQLFAILLNSREEGVFCAYSALLFAMLLIIIRASSSCRTIVISFRIPPVYMFMSVPLFVLVTLLIVLHLKLLSFSTISVIFFGY